MANKQTTSWVLEFIDEITKPLKSATKSVTKATSFIDDMTDSVKFNAKESKEALTNAKKYYSDLKTQIQDTERELKDLSKAQKSDNWKEAMEAGKAYDKASEKVKKLRIALDGAEKDIKDLTDESDKFAKSAKKWDDTFTGINQGVELMQKGVDGLSFTNDISTLRTEIQKMTDSSGASLDNYTKSASRLGDVYNQDALEIAKSANVLTNQIGGSFEDNLAIIESGFQRGANINGDFLQQLQEYPAFIKQLGIDQSQAVALIAKANKMGIYDDKAVDSLKEATLSLKEMGKAQVDALAGIGIKPEDLVGKTPFEAVQLISKQMKGASTQARQLILADIFKGAGEDAGIQFIEGLGTMDLDLTKLPAVQESASGLKGFFSEIKNWAADSFGNIGSYAQTLAPMVMTVSGMIPIMQMLSNSTKVQTAAQWLLNIAMNANPIGLIVLGIAALIALVVVIIKKYDEWGAAVSFLMGPLGWIINLVQSFRRHWDSIVEAFKSEGIIGALKRIGVVILDALLMPIQQLLELIAKIPGMKGIAGGAADWIKQQRESLNLTTTTKEEKKAPVESKKGVNDLLQNKPDVLDGKDQSKDGKKKGEKEGDPLSVGSGSGGIKSITMTLNVTNNFAVSQGSNLRDIADKITTEINDRLRDSVISIG